MIDENAHVVVRRFNPDRDSGPLRDCIVEHQNFHRSLEPTWPPGEAIADQYRAHLEGECAAHNGCIIMAEYAERTAGFVCVVAAKQGESPDDPASFAWIHDIIVKPAHRWRGVARALITDAERFAQSQGARVLRLGVLDRNDDARRFYEGHDFREYAHVLTKTLGKD